MGKETMANMICTTFIQNQRRFRHTLVPGSPTAAVFMVKKVV